MTARHKHFVELERKKAKARKAEAKREKAEERAGLVTYDAATGAIRRAPRGYTTQRRRREHDSTKPYRSESNAVWCIWRATQATPPPAIKNSGTCPLHRNLPRRQGLWRDFSQAEFTSVWGQASNRERKRG